MKKSWAFSDVVAAISAALHETFVRSKYANSVSQFLLHWMRIVCCIYFLRQLKAFLPSFCHLRACEMSPGWEHLITWLDPSVGYLNGILARVGGNLNNNFQKKSNARAGGCPGHVEASIWPIHKSNIDSDMASSSIRETAGFTIQTRDKRNPPLPPPPLQLRSHACVVSIHDREATWWNDTLEDSPWKLTRRLHKAIATNQTSMVIVSILIRRNCLQQHG